MERLNYFFEPCHAVTSSGPTVALPAGHGMVTLEKDGSSESVYFPSKQLGLKLIPGEIGRLEKRGLARRYGSVR